MNLKENVSVIADKIKGKISIDKTGLGTAEDGLFASALPEDLDMKTVQKAHDYTRDFTAATAKVFGEAAQEAMVKDKKLETATITIETTKGGSVSHNYERSKTYPNMSGGEPIQQYGVLTSKVTQQAGRNIGDLGKVRKALKEAAEAALK